MEDVEQAHISTITASTPDGWTQAYVGQWWIVNTDIGHTYAKIVDWRKAYGRVNWIIVLIGDTAPHPVASTRFVRRETPPLVNPDWGQTPRTQQGKKKLKTRKVRNKADRFAENFDGDTEFPDS